MLHAYRVTGQKIEPLSPGTPFAQACWIDLFRPDLSEVAAVQPLGIEVPTLEDMEEIEISNRLYREDGIDYMTVVLPGRNDADEAISAPVSFILTPGRMFTVRHHRLRPFETYPLRADKVGPGCGDPDRLFLSLVEEIIGRLADHLEGVGKALDVVAHEVYAEGDTATGAALQSALRRTGREGEAISRVRLALLTMERMLSYFGQTLHEAYRGEALIPLVKGFTRDLQALEVHADFLSTRVGLATDATLGMINLSQNQTIKIVSVVAAVFLPPTLIASAYGMNFNAMPELQWRWGYPMAVGMMVASAVGTFVFFRWKKWL
ncbi:MAG: magnesium transporter CorA family protein [Gemmobacter sp.]